MDNQEQPKQYRFKQNVKHNGTNFSAGQVVTGFTADVAANLIAVGFIEELNFDKPTNVVDVNDAKKDQAQVAGAPAQAATAASNLQKAAVVGQQTTVTPPASPAQQQAVSGPQGGGTTASDGLTEEQRAVANTASQVN